MLSLNNVQVVTAFLFCASDRLKCLRELLINNSGGTMDKQKEILETTIEEWQNGYEIKNEQTDGITIPRIRI